MKPQTDMTPRTSSTWCDFCSSIDWASQFPSLQKLGKAEKDLDLIDDLLTLDIFQGLFKPYMDAQADPKCAHHMAAHKFGFFFALAEAHLGANLAASYVERVNSAANLIMTDGCTLLGHLTLERCVILRMNKVWMYFMKDNFPACASGCCPDGRGGG